MGCRLWGRTESDTTEVTSQQQQHFVYKQCVRILVASWSSHHLVVSLTSFNHSKTAIGILDAYWYLTVVLICLSLTAKDGGHFFRC